MRPSGHPQRAGTLIQGVRIAGKRIGPHALVRPKVWRCGKTPCKLSAVWEVADNRAILEVMRERTAVEYEQLRYTVRCTTRRTKTSVRILADARYLNAADEPLASFWKSWKSGSSGQDGFSICLWQAGSRALPVKANPRGLDAKNFEAEPRWSEAEPR
jgi:hypothetical protein